MSAAQRFPVCLWPKVRPAPEARVFVLALAGERNRETASAAARAALREALAPRLGLPAEDIALVAPSGQTPRIASHPGLGLSISHAAGLSLAAANFDGPLGLDLIRNEIPPDWANVARDYLPPERLDELRARNGDGFARAWAEHEAVLKLHGQALEEWHPSFAQLYAASRREPLALPEAWVGCLALRA